MNPPNAPDISYMDPDTGLGGLLMIAHERWMDYEERYERFEDAVRAIEWQMFQQASLQETLYTKEEVFNMFADASVYAATGYAPLHLEVALEEVASEAASESDSEADSEA